MQAPFYLVVETSGSNSEHDTAKLEAFLEEVYADGVVADGTIAQDSTQAAGIWHLRESISVGLRHAGTGTGDHSGKCRPLTSHVTSFDFPLSHFS